MSMTISVLGGVGLFLLGMTVMTQSLKALAGSSLRTVLSNAAATPLRGAFWGAVFLTRRSILGPMIGHAGFNLTQVAKFMIVGS